MSFDGETIVQFILPIVVSLCTLWVAGLILLFSITEILNIIRWAYAVQARKRRK